jgi:hypothetical protein
MTVRKKTQSVNASTARSTILLAAVLAMLIYSGCSTSAPNPDAVALKPNLLDAIDYELPASFYGCWEGTIDNADSVTPLNWTGNHARIEPNTYQLCYRRRPESGGELLLTKFEAGGNNFDVISFDNHVTAVDEGRRTARLRNHVLLEHGHNLLWVYPVYGREDIYADENIAMKSDNLISMSGKELIQVNGADAAIVTFHADFHRVPDKTQP